jgi:hypothetical protein
MDNSQYRWAGESNYHGRHGTYLQRPRNSRHLDLGAPCQVMSRIP